MTEVRGALALSVLGGKGVVQSRLNSCALVGEMWALAIWLVHRNRTIVVTGGR